MTLPDHKFYTTNGFHNIKDPVEFARLLVHATIKLNHFEQVWTITYYPFPDKPDDYMQHMALCELCDEIQLTHKANSVSGEDGVARSISIGSVSTSFDGVSAENIIKTEQSRYETAIKNYAHIYKGVR